MVLVPIVQDPQRKNSERGRQDEYLANRGHARTEDEHCPKNEKQTDCTFGRYVMDRNAGMIGNGMIRNDRGAGPPAFISTIAEQEYQNSGNDSSGNPNEKNHPNVGQQDGPEGGNDEQQSECMSHWHRGCSERNPSYVPTQSQKHDRGDLPPIPETSTALLVLL
jgi:hypothetical protein